MRKIKIGTRASRLALWQAEFVAAELKKFFPTLEVELVKVKTTGDKILDAPLAKIGGKGLFTKELELQLAGGEIDLAVHSLKDVPTELPKNFKIAAITKRAQPFDAFISNNFPTFASLPKNSVVGTSSLRRAAQILALRPDLKIKNLRGNVETRLKKLDAGDFDGEIFLKLFSNKFCLPKCQSTCSRSNFYFRQKFFLQYKKFADSTPTNFFISINYFLKWSEQQDLNLRPSDPKSDALAKLSYAPKNFYCAADKSSSPSSDAFTTSFKASISESTSIP